MNNYELLLAVSEGLSEEAQKKQVKELTETIEKNAGEVSSTDSWGKKTLAFQISGSKTAFYWLLTFKGSSALPKIISDQFRINDQILRFLITTKRVSKKPLAKVKKKVATKEPAFIR